jgi:Domain of unknown function (DUF4263)
MCTERLDATAPTEITGKAVRINHADLRKLLSELRRIKSLRFEELVREVRSFLHKTSPTKFEAPVQSGAVYQPNTLVLALKKSDALAKLSKEDIEVISGFLPSFIEKHGTAGDTKAKLFSLSGTKRATQVVYIQQIIKEFESKLEKRTLEHTWQEFLRDYILLFNSNYATVLEKKNIAVLGAKLPDFMLLDAYSYLDIYEIKTPSTNLLKHDKSHDNYYWDPEIVKAISQVENYVANADRNSNALCGEIKRHLALEARIIRPRGFIIAGRRTQLVTEVMEDNFRLLNDSLKNISIILFDELLAGLKSFLGKLKTD